MIDQNFEGSSLTEIFKDTRFTDNDLLDIKTRATTTYLDSSLRDVPGEILPYVNNIKKAKTLAGSSKVYPNISKFFKAILNNIQKLYSIHIPWRMDTFQPLKDDWGFEDLQNVNNQLVAADIPSTQELLLTVVSSDPRRLITVLNVVREMQNEYVQIIHATRIMEESKRMLSQVAPFIEWPRREILAYTTQNQTWEQTGSWTAYDDGTHIVIIREPSIDINSMRLDLKRTDFRNTGSLAFGYISAVHEAAGHGGFAELYSPQVLKSSFEGKNTAPSMAHVLSEGYALLVEEIATLGKSGEKEVRLQDSAVSKFQVVRLEHLVGIIQQGKEIDQAKRQKVIELLQSGKEINDDVLKGVLNENEQKIIKNLLKRRVYTNGKSIMLEMLRQLGVKDGSPEVKYQKIREFLKDVDLEAASKIFYGTPSYLECLTDPIHKLPRKKPAKK